MDRLLRAAGFDCTPAHYDFHCRRVARDLAGLKARWVLQMKFLVPDERLAEFEARRAEVETALVERVSQSVLSELAMELALAAAEGSYRRNPHTMIHATVKPMVFSYPEPQSA